MGRRFHNHPSGKSRGPASDGGGQAELDDGERGSWRIGEQADDQAGHRS
jgi:hypothetical protein